MRIYMQTGPVEGRPPRFYHLLLQQDLLGGWSLIREWGQQGSAGRVCREHHLDRESAEAAMARWRSAQQRRGFRVVFIEGEAERS